MQINMISTNTITLIISFVFFTNYKCLSQHHSKMQKIVFQISIIFCRNIPQASLELKIPPPLPKTRTPRDSILE